MWRHFLHCQLAPKWDLKLRPAQYILPWLYALEYDISCRPKMPCLRCGCAWYNGEDWDAVCMRCGWDCQISGYDDDSQPLPPFRAQWQDFTAAIKQGTLPGYSGTRTRLRK